MKINQVEELTGITKKNIRFYEEQKLISPQRNPANGYREYSMEDVKQLSRIKLLRKLGIPIESIRKMESGEMKLDDCMIKRVHELKETVQSARMMQTVCQEMLDQTAGFDKIDTELYLAEIDKLEKGGTQFMNIEQHDKRPSIFTGPSKNSVSTMGSVIPSWSSMRFAMRSASSRHLLSVSTPLSACFLTMRTPRSSFLRLFLRRTIQALM